ncbi:MAG: hypothetical protein GY856_12225 [bacterium]|nr:hypothetical protein [bacterium]
MRSAEAVLSRFLEAQREDPVLADVAALPTVDLRVVRTDDLGPPEEVDEIQARVWRDVVDRLLIPGRRTLLAGVPGAGKTVTLGLLALALTRRARRALDRNEEPEAVPVWLAASDVPDGAGGSPLRRIPQVGGSRPRYHGPAPRFGTPGPPPRRSPGVATGERALAQRPEPAQPARADQGGHHPPRFRLSPCGRP